MTEQDEAARKAYAEGRWCGECRFGVVESPPCCTAVSLDLDALLSEAEVWASVSPPDGEMVPARALHEFAVRVVSALRSVQVPVEWEYARVDPRGNRFPATFDSPPLIDEGWSIERRSLGPWEPVPSTGTTTEEE